MTSLTRGIWVVDRYQQHEIPQISARLTQCDQHSMHCGCGRVHTGLMDIFDFGSKATSEAAKVTSKQANDILSNGAKAAQEVGKMSSKTAPWVIPFAGHCPTISIQ
jgi:hypothetical protein